MIKIKISYENFEELQPVYKALQPFCTGKVRLSDGSKYKLMYLEIDPAKKANYKNDLSRSRTCESKKPNKT